MTWLQDASFWIAALFVAFIAAWLRNLLSALFPSPQRAILALRNLILVRPPARNQVRFVLGWLDNDYEGSNTTAVSATFAEIEGIELCRSARIVSATGAADEWRAGMRRKSKNLLAAWDADIAVVGRVDKDGDALSLWFVRSDDDTLADISSNPYLLRFNRLADDFVDHFHVQIRALVLALVIPKATSGDRQQLDLLQLKAAVPKLENLFRTLSAQEHRISLCMVYVLAQSSLGEWLGEGERLRSAIEKAKEITEGTNIVEDADATLTTRVNLARTLYILGEREGNPKYLAESISLLEEVLNAGDRPDRASIAAGIKGLAANALRALGHLEGKPDYLHRAASLLESALDIHQRQSDAPLVAISQNNLGLVHLDLGLAERRIDALRNAIGLLDSASALADQVNMPTLWAMTQNNTGKVYEALAELDLGSGRTELEKARHHYQKAVNGYSQTLTPYHLASAKTSLGRVLTNLGALTGSINYLDQAIENLEDANTLSSQEPKSTSLGAIRAGLGTALLQRGKVRANARDLEKAVVWLGEALNVYHLDASPENWVKIKSNLAMSYFELAKVGKDANATAQGFSLIEEILVERDLSAVLVNSPEPYFAFYQGIDLIRSLDHRTDYVQAWIATWVPVFTDGSHKAISKRTLAFIQNDLAIVLQDRRALTDAVEMSRRSLANMESSGDSGEVSPSSSTTFLGQSVTSDPLNVDLVETDIKRNLGTACRMLGEKRASASLLKEALALFDEVLAAVDLDVNPMNWAITQSGKGRAYKALYHVEGDVDWLRLSLSAYDEAMDKLIDGLDSLWHRQVPLKREEVRRLLEQELGT